MIIPLPKKIRNVLNRLISEKYEAYVVGGCIRNSLLNLPVNDYDVTTDALPDEVERIFSDCKVIKTGIKHGTVTVLTEKESVEITTYRTDGKYSDNRHPDSVTFTRNLHDDLSRRDFTVNAMAYNHINGIVDFFGGLDDLEKGIIRCVGVPQTRFKEDSLRILRALRFASVYGFDIEEDTSCAMLDLRKLIDNVSKERIANELNGFIVGKNAGKLLMKYRDIFAQILPEIRCTFDMRQDNPHHDKDIWEHTCAVVDNSDSDLEIRLAALFHDIGKAHCKTVDKNGTGHFYGHPEISAEIAHSIMKRLKYPNKLTSNVVTLVRYHDRLRNMGMKGMRRLYGKIGPELMEKLLNITRADTLAQSSYKKGEKLNDHDEKERMLRRIIDENLCCTVKDLDISGRDLTEHNIAKGKDIGKTLDFLLQTVISGKVKNDREAMLSFLADNNAVK